MMYPRSRQKILLILVFNVVLVTACQKPSIKLIERNTLSSINADAQVTLQQDVDQVPADFIGMSIELSQICEIISLDEQHRTSYEQLYLNLAPGVLHIGGHSSDLSTWEPYGIASCKSSHPLMTEAIVNAVFTFARRIHWKVTWGLNLIANNPLAAASEADYVAAVGGSDLIDFTIGNEPDLYTKHGYRPSGWGFNDYISEWEQYRKAVLNAVPSAQFSGPDVCCETSLFPGFLADEGKNIINASHHYYITSLHDKLTEPSDLLSRQVNQSLVSFLTEWVTLAREAGVPLEMSETNTISNNGVAGISNSFAAALWASDYLFQAASLGIRRVDFQSALKASYNAISDVGTPQALYYGLLFFHTIAENAEMVQTTIQSSLNISAYTFISTDGTLRMALINKESKGVATVNLETGNAYHSIEVMQLTAPNIGATTAITLGEKSVSIQGTWEPVASTVLPVHSSGVVVEIPADSAEYIEINKSSQA